MICLHWSRGLAPWCRYRRITHRAQLSAWNEARDPSLVKRKLRVCNGVIYVRVRDYPKYMLEISAKGKTGGVDQASRVTLM
jgi:hypothetical protein